MKSKLYRKDVFWGYAFIAPLLLGLLVFLLVPLLSSVYISMSSYDLANKPVFKGLANFEQLVKDPIFWKSIVNSLYASLGVPLGMLLALIVALMLNKPDIRGKGFFRMLFFMPTICSAVAVTFMWKWVLNDDFGLINQVLKMMKIKGPNWFSESLAMPSMIMMGVWGGMGISLLLYLSALYNVPRVYYEAAKVDGAGPLRQFFSITLPGISPVTFYILVTGLIGALQDFTRFQIMTDGGPNYATTTTVLYIYNNAFQYADMGYACAMGWALGVIIAVVTIANFVMSRRWVYYD